jgi:hypothetical protein
MQANAEKKIHCAANKIVSAFIYLYRRLYEGISDAESKKYFYQIWQKFIEKVIDFYK